MAIDQLQRLADKHGIAAVFTDNFGNQQRTEPDVMRAILRALGEPLETGSADPVLNTAAVGSASQGMPPVAVVTLGESVQQTLEFAHHPGGSSTQSVPPVESIKQASIACRYSIESEQGEVYNGQVVLTRAKASASVDSAGSQNALLRYHLALPLPHALASGYHRLFLEFAEAEDLPHKIHSFPLIVVPQQAFSIDSRDKPIGVSVQLYSLRSDSNWGMGDFTDLRDLCSILVRYGIDTVGLNPVHALYGQHPARCSPYSPSSRVFLNPLYIDVMAIPGVESFTEFQSLILGDDFRTRLASLRQAGQIDYDAVAALKHEALRMIFRAFFAESDAQAQVIRRFHQFIEQRGEDLQRYARFEAFDQYFSSVKALESWTEWPACYHDPDTTECRELAVQLVDDITFHCFLQWIADEQLAAAAAHCSTLGMRYGLYMDLAVGVDRQGGEVWAGPQQFARGMHIGAPPDALGPLGQDWSLTPYNPYALKESGYQAFVDVIRAAMRFAGVLRIDHVMGLARQYWCVPGLRLDASTAAGTAVAAPTPGAYVNFPLDDLLGLVALESQRNQCVVIGEDLGTVPEGFRDNLRQRGIHGYRVLYFEKDAAGNFRQPRHYEPQTLATASTHDLPTLAGYLNRRDIMLRVGLGHIGEDSKIAETLALRQQELANLLGLLPQHNPAWLESVFPVDNASSEAENNLQPLPGTAEFINAVHRLLAQTQSAILVLQLEDLLQQLDMANLPGTIDEHPNWKRRLALPVEELREHLSSRDTLIDVVELRKAG